MKPLALFLLSFTLLAQRTANQNMVRQRGQTPVQDERETMTRGRIGSQQMMPLNEITVTGILVDASCEDRTSLNMRSRPLALPPAAAAQSAGAVSASGVSIGAQTVQQERADVLAHLVPDVVARQQDPSCAVTASTSGYAMLTDSGRLLNLDQGGNTLVSAAILGSPGGRAMLNGQGPGIKPRTSVKGWILDDKVIVDRILTMQ
jgi:hypothetical protein